MMSPTACVEVLVGQIEGAGARPGRGHVRGLNADTVGVVDRGGVIVERALVWRDEFPFGRPMA